METLVKALQQEASIIRPKFSSASRPFFPGSDYSFAHNSYQLEDGNLLNPTECVFHSHLHSFMP